MTGGNNPSGPGGQAPREAALLDALRDVFDPEFPISIVDMGLIVDIREHRGTVDVKLTLTSMGCPAVDMIMEDIEARLLREPGIASVAIEIVWDPIWSPRRLSADGRLALQEMGIAV